MGLDMCAYTASRAGQHNDFYEGEGEMVDGQWKSATITKPREIAYWRKHPNLHGWMEELWIDKLAAEGKEPGESQFGSTFNGVELELTWEDLDQLEQDVTQGRLPDTTGFFFGDPADNYYREQDLEFIRKARAELFLGLKVFYNSSW